MITAILTEIRRPRILAVLMGMTALLTVPSTAQVTPVGGIARNFTLTNRATGQPLKLTDFAGKVLVLDFFAYWCGPCQASSPDVETNIQEYYATRGGNAFGVPVQVLAVNTEPLNPALTDAFVAAAGLELVGNDPNTTAGAWSQFNEANGIPLFVIINCVADSPSHAQWKVLYKQAGYAGASTLRGVIDQVKPAVVPAPEIAVEQPAGTNIADAGAKDFGTLNVGSSTTLAFTIRNTGTANLTGLAITKNGTNPADFTVTSSPVAPVAGPNGTTTFMVRFTPSALGLRSAVIHIANNDSDEAPFDITLTGTGTFFEDFDPDYSPALWAQFGGSVAANCNGQAAGSWCTGNSLWFGGGGSRYATTQPMDTRSGGNVSFLLALANGTSSPWESADVGEEVVLEYSNDGTTFVQIGGPCDNRVWQKCVLAIPAAAQTIATRFRFRQLSNSGAEYDHWAIEDVQIGSGVVIAPEIAVEQPAGTGLTDGSSTVNFNMEGSDSCSRRVFAIRNVGTADLTLGAVTCDGTNAADFAPGSPGANTLAPGAATTLTVTFTPDASGSGTATLHIASNDGDENPFDINLIGTGLFTAIQNWRQTYFGTTSNTGTAEDTADPYHTGIPNLLVFAFAGPHQNPVSAKVSQLPQMQHSGGTLFYSFTQPAGVNGVTYGAEWSQTLGEWEDVPDTGISPQHTFSVPIDTKTRLYMRLKVTSP